MLNKNCPGNESLTIALTDLRRKKKDLISNKQKRTKRICQKWRRYGHYKILKPIFLNRP